MRTNNPYKRIIAKGLFLATFLILVAFFFGEIKPPPFIVMRNRRSDENTLNETKKLVEVIINEESEKCGKRVEKIGFLKTHKCASTTIQVLITPNNTVYDMYFN